MSEGDAHLKARKRASKQKRKKSKSKRKSKKSSPDSFSSSSSSSISSDSDSKHKGVYSRRCAKASKKRVKDRERKVCICSLMRKALDGHFNTFKPVEIIQKGIEKFTGVKGVDKSTCHTMDTEVFLTEEKKKLEHMLFTVQKGVLAALSAIIPVANRMMEQEKFTSLAADMDEGVEMLAATSTFINFRRFENVFKSVTTDAGKEVSRSKKIKDKDGKEYTLFLPPHPIKGKPLDKTKMFGGQLTQLLKQAESGNKCGKQMGTKRKNKDNAPSQNKKGRFAGKQRRGFFKGARQHFNFNSFGRGRGQRQQSFGWNNYNRPVQGFHQGPSAAQGKPTGFQKAQQK